MNEGGTRPGGLTALAVINFIFGGFGILFALGTLATPALMRAAAQHHEQRQAAESRAETTQPDATEQANTRATRPQMTEEQQRREAEAMEQIEKIKSVPMITFIIHAAVKLIIAVLMIVSAVGYLKLRRFLGRTLGTIYAVLSIAWTCVEVAYADKLLGQSFQLFSVVWLIYPAITLWCLRIVFKDDFINP